MPSLLAALAALFALSACADIRAPDADPFADTRTWLEQCRDC